MKHPTVSVIIPTLNAGRTITLLLDSLLANVVPPLEIILVDDGSSDDTADIVGRYAGVIFLRNHRSKGAGGARNTGAEAACGDILLFTDSDCIVPTDWIARIVAAFAGGGVAAVAGGYSGHAGGTFIGHFADLELRLRRKDFPERVETAVSNNFAVRNDIFRKVNGFPEEYEGATVEDLICSYRVSRQGAIRWLSDNGVRHHFHETLDGYLRQQRAFARDTVLAFRRHSELSTVRSHHGRQLYLEIVLSLAAIGMLPFEPRVAAGVILAVPVMHLPLIAETYRALGVMGVVRTVSLIPVKNINIILGILQGIARLPWCQRSHHG